jgi:hypothetical protein
MKKHIFETTTKIIFMCLFAIVVILISLGIKQDFSRIKTATFWTETGAQLFATMIIFNIVYSIDLNSRMHDKSSRFFSAYATNVMRIKEIENKKLYDDLDKAVDLKNKEILVKKCNLFLHKLCTRVCYEDVIAEDTIEEIIKKFRVAKKREKTFTKLVKQIREGSIKTKPIKSELFLQDKEALFSKEDVYDFNNIAYELKRNSIKMLTFLLCSIITATITFSFVSPNFWTALLTNFTLFLGATVSGFTSSAKSIKQKTALYEKRNQFLHKYLDLTIEYNG